MPFYYANPKVTGTAQRGQTGRKEYNRTAPSLFITTFSTNIATWFSVYVLAHLHLLVASFDGGKRENCSIIVPHTVENYAPLYKIANMFPLFRCTFELV